MAKTYFKGKNNNRKLKIKLLSLAVIVVGGIIFGYTFFPLISWQIYFAPAFASQKISSPIPNHTVINPTNIGNLIASAKTSIGTDFKDAYNWYPGFDQEKDIIANYRISIPEINIHDAVVTNKDTDLSKHLVQYNSDSVPPNEGNSIIWPLYPSSII
jgi:sortase A